MKYRKTFREAWDETKPQSVNEQEEKQDSEEVRRLKDCLLYTSPSPRDRQKSRMPSSA